MMSDLRAIVWPEGDAVVAQYLEVDIASQGTSTDEALLNLREALELFLDVAEPGELTERFRHGIRIHCLGIPPGQDQFPDT